MENTTQTLLRLCNQARFDAGVNLLQVHSSLQAVAQGHAEAMATGAYFDHVDTQGRGAGERLLAAVFNYRWAGENISAGKQDVEAVFHWWMSSVGHRANILKAEFTLMGLGYCFIESDRLAFQHYWVQIFAAPF